MLRKTFKVPLRRVSDSDIISNYKTDKNFRVPPVLAIINIGALTAEPRVWEVNSLVGKTGGFCAHLPPKQIINGTAIRNPPPISWFGLSFAMFHV